MSALEDETRAIADALFADVPADASLTVELKAESSDFVRIARSKARQAGHVDEAELSLRLVRRTGDQLREASTSFSLSKHAATDLERARALFSGLSREVDALPPNPFAEIARPRGTSRRHVTEPAPAVDLGDMLEPARGLDLSGHSADGTIVRAVLSSAGTSHWFETTRSVVDASLYADNGKAVKMQLAGERFSATGWSRLIDDARTHLSVIARPPVRLAPGGHRVYLGPMAVAEILEMLSWGCVGEAAIRQGDSPLRRAREQRLGFSPLLSLREDFSTGDVPAFTEEGDLAPPTVSLIEKGELVGSLVSSRTSREYGVTENGAQQSEAMRAPAIDPGTMARDEIVKRIGDGIYIPNLWYLNWSDQPGGRITGMTRYATMQVVAGELVAPIENLRFDDTIFRILGTSLEALDDTASLVPATLTYDFRSLGGARVPGMLLSELRFPS